MRVMLAFDGSFGAEAARDVVANLRWPAATAFTLVTVAEHAAAKLQEMLAAAAAPLRGPLRTVETRVVYGRPASALLEEAAALPADLIVVGSRGHGPIATVLLGSVSTELVDHAPCPVLVARHPSVHRLVVGVDGSASADAMIRVLVRWPIFTGLPAHVVTVAERDHFAGVAAQACAELSLGGLRSTAVIREGDPADQLLRAAADEDADLIVVGTRGLTTLPRLVMGSVARKVLLHAPTSVMVVRHARERSAVGARAPIGAVAAGGMA